MYIFGVMLHKKNDSTWIAFPGIPYEKDGKKSYKPVVEIPNRGRRDKFNEQVIAALKSAGHV